MHPDRTSSTSPGAPTVPGVGGVGGVPHDSGPAPERVVLLAPDGHVIGEADKATVHGPSTPYHLAFSCYAFDPRGRLLVTRRAVAKRTFPGVWTNTCCGHPAPGEAVPLAVRRRLQQELGLEPHRLRPVLPEFTYRANDGAVEENELCPVFLCVVTDDPAPDPDEVDDHAWLPWSEFADRALRPDSEVSPWARMQVRELVDGGHVEQFLGDLGAAAR